MNNPFYILDVFAETKYAGNQLAVVMDAGNLTTPQMQQITREFNFSETTFILSDTPRNSGYDVRIFTPAAEVPFAGHPTIGTAFVLQDKIEHWARQTVTLNLKVGSIPVTYTALDNRQRILWLKAPQPQFEACFTPQDFAPILNLNIADFDERFPIQSISTGLPFILVPLRTLDSVRRAKANLEAFELFLKTHDTARMIFLFCPQTHDPANHIHCRMFGHLYGVPEDPATGSANSCLAAYLTCYRYFGDSKIDIRVEQGYEIGRPSLLYLQAERHNESFDIRVGGKTHITAAGTLL